MINGTPGNDNLLGGDTIDYINGGAGDDLIDGGAGGDVLDGEDGTDILYGGEGNDQLRNSEDSAIPGAENDQLYGQGGDDFLSLYITSENSQSVVLDGGTGDDVLHFNSLYYIHQVTLLGGDGADQIDLIGGGTVTLDAGAGDDSIAFSFSTAAAPMTLVLGAGSDTVQIRSAGYLGSVLPAALHIADFAGGGAGDRLAFEYFLSHLVNWDYNTNPFATGHVALSQRVGVGAVLSLDLDGGGDAFQDFVILEGADAVTLGLFNLGFNPDGSVTTGLVLDGTTRNDYLSGSGDGDLLRGLDGQDQVFGFAGNDVLEGGEGHDALDGGMGDDRLYGGVGEDRLTDMAGGNDELYGGDGIDHLSAGRTSAAAPSVVLLDGGENNDVLHFGSERLHFDDVTLRGGNGDDQISVSRALNAVIDAGAGDDYVSISTWLTDYSITLGAGSDRLALSSHLGPPGIAIVEDFETGEAGDRLLIDYYLQADPASWEPGRHPYAEGFARVVQSGADAVLQIDRDGPSGSGGFVDLVVLRNVAADALTTHNLGGYSRILGTAASETLLGTGAADFMLGFEGNDTIDGGADNDTLSGGSGSDVLIGGSGHDRLDGGAGNDTMAGGLGNDTYVIDGLGDAVNELAGQGTDTLVLGFAYALAAGSAVENLTLSDAAATTAINLTGNAAANALTGNAGADLLNGLAGNDVLVGLDGSDTLHGGAGNDRLDGGEGSDVFHVDSAGDVVLEVADVPVDEIDLPDTDVVYASVTYALAAAAHVEVLSTASLAATAAINLTGNGFAQTLTGNAGANLLSGLAGNDVLVGLDGNDTLHGGVGNDTMIGGAGNDVYHVDVAGDVVLEAAGGGTDTVYTGWSYALAAGAHVELLSAASLVATAAINLTGNALAQTIYGNAGANVLNGLGGSDVLVGLGGNDTYHVDAAGDVVSEGVGGGVDIVYASASYALAGAAEIETLSTSTLWATAAIDLTGNGFAQTIYGNAGANLLVGLGGNDTLVGLGGNDTLNGGSGSDTLVGGTGNDVYHVDAAGDMIQEATVGGTDVAYASVSYALAADAEVETLSTSSLAATTATNLTGNGFAQTIYGNAGANLLDGLGGSDVLVGLGGADTFAFTTALGFGNVGTIAGFDAADDTIRLENAVFTGLATGALAGGAFNTGAIATQADDRIIYNSATGALLFDVDGLGGAAEVQFATLSPGLALTGADFVVV